jgi:hypothetical protein
MFFKAFKIAIHSNITRWFESYIVFFFAQKSSLYTLKYQRAFYPSKHFPYKAEEKSSPEN